MRRNGLRQCMPDSVRAGLPPEVVIYIIDNTAMQEGTVMVTLDANIVANGFTWEEGLRLYFDELFGKDLPMNERTAELYAHVIAAMYGPALKELEKH